MNNKDKVDKLLKHKFFVTQVTYPPQNGFLDYGPTLIKTKHQIHKSWRKIFIEENMFEIEPSVILPYDVLKNSGHIDKFCDVILTDGISIFRADHLIEDKIGEWHFLPKLIDDKILLKLKEIKNLIFNKTFPFDKVGNLNKFQQFKIEIVEMILKSFDCVKKHLSNCNKIEIDFIVSLNNLTTETSEFLPAKDFNLIFKLNETQFLRPELAQSQFTNFKKIYELNNCQMPFATYSIGKSYRNEISARGGMLRTKEFEQAEIEYFTEDGNHSNFDKIIDKNILILPNSVEVPYKISLKEAFNTKIISSSAICYFIGKAQEFLLDIGIKLEKIRYRQHNISEMAHYANDCWDVEILTLTGWVECAGIADRSTFDLKCHSNNVNPYVKKFIKPKKVYFLEIDKKSLIKKLKGKFQEFEEKVKSISEEEIKQSIKKDECDDERGNDNKTDINKCDVNKTENNKTENKCDDNLIFKFIFENESYDLKIKSKFIEFVEYIPRVIEPSFGISRILYSLIEQSLIFEKERTILSLKPKMAYKQVCITTLRNSTKFDDLIEKIKIILKEEEIDYLINNRSCSIGKKYLSCDEIGIPFFITLDEKSLIDETVTIRNRDTTEQIRVKIFEIKKILKNLINEEINWEEIFSKLKI